MFLFQSCFRARKAFVPEKRESRPTPTASEWSSPSIPTKPWASSCQTSHVRSTLVGRLETRLPSSLPCRLLLFGSCPGRYNNNMFSCDFPDNPTVPSTWFLLTCSFLQERQSRTAERQALREFARCGPQDNRWARRKRLQRQHFSQRAVPRVGGELLCDSSCGFVPCPCEFCKACLASRTKVVAVCGTESHGSRLELLLTDHILGELSREGSTFFRPESVAKDNVNGKDETEADKKKTGSGKKKIEPDAKTEAKPKKKPRKLKKEEEEADENDDDEGAEDPKPKKKPRKIKKEEDEEDGEGSSEMWWAA